MRARQLFAAIRNDRNSSNPPSLKKIEVMIEGTHHGIDYAFPPAHCSREPIAHFSSLPERGRHVGDPIGAFSSWALSPRATERGARVLA
jgi:hypothetical protein